MKYRFTSSELNSWFGRFYLRVSDVQHSLLSEGLISKSHSWVNPPLIVKLSYLNWKIRGESIEIRSIGKYIYAIGRRLSSWVCLAGRACGDFRLTVSRLGFFGFYAAVVYRRICQIFVQWRFKNLGWISFFRPSLNWSFLNLYLGWIIYEDLIGMAGARWKLLGNAGWWGWKGSRWGSKIYRD